MRQGFRVTFRPLLLVLTSLPPAAPSIGDQVGFGDLNGSHTLDFAQTLGQASDRFRAPHVDAKRDDAFFCGGAQSPSAASFGLKASRPSARPAPTSWIPLDLHFAHRELAACATRKRLSKDAASVLIGNLQRRRLPAGIRQPALIEGNTKIRLAEERSKVHHTLLSARSATRQRTGALSSK
jgi:hypothetical protein